MEEPVTAPYLNPYLVVDPERLGPPPAAEPQRNAKMATEDLNVYYGQFHAIKHVTLSLPDHRVSALSGCQRTQFHAS